MSDVDDFDNDDDSGSTSGGGNGAKVLRQQNSQLTAQLAELQKEIDAFRAEKRTATIASVLAEKQANPKLAKYVSRDLDGDVTVEAVAKWLEDEGELFGYQPPSGDDGVDEAVETAQQRVSQVVSSAPTGGRSGITQERLKQMTPAQLIEAGLLDPK